jgi:hypothetical protein
MDFGIRCVASKLGFDVAGGVLARRIQIAEVVDVGGLTDRLDCLRG